MPPVFDDKKCIKCGMCVRDCPAYILELDKNDNTVKTPHIIEEYKFACCHCGNCRFSCKQNAITFKFPLYTLV